MSRANPRLIGERMSTAEWVALYYGTQLRSYFLESCRALTRNVDLRADLYQESWKEIGLCPGGKCEAYYQEAGLRAMDRYRKRQQPAWAAGDKVKKRLKRVAKKYVLKRGRRRGGGGERMVSG